MPGGKRWRGRQQALGHDQGRKGTEEEATGLPNMPGEENQSQFIGFLESLHDPDVLCCSAFNSKGQQIADAELALGSTSHVYGKSDSI